VRLLEEDAADVRHRVRRALRHRLVHRVGEDVLQLVLLDVLGDLARRVDLLARHDGESQIRLRREKKSR